MGVSTPTSPSADVDPAVLARYADLIVGFGANVQPGQIVEVRADLEKRALVHEIAAAASLLMGQGDEGRPMVVVRGLDWHEPPSGIGALLRSPKEDLFR